MGPSRKDSTRCSQMQNSSQNPLLINFKCKYLFCGFHFAKLLFTNSKCCGNCEFQPKVINIMSKFPFRSLILFESEMLSNTSPLTTLNADSILLSIYICTQIFGMQWQPIGIGWLVIVYRIDFEYQLSVIDSLFFVDKRNDNSFVTHFR